MTGSSGVKPALRVLGIVPARAGSQRVPGKNVRLLRGKPLVAWAIEAARGARRLDRLVVSSDDERVLKIARDYDPRLPLRRPGELAGNESLAIDFVRHALTELEAVAQSTFDAVAIVQPSSPFTLPEDIDATIDLLTASGADSAVSVVEVEHALHPAQIRASCCTGIGCSLTSRTSTGGWRPTSCRGYSSAIVRCM